MITLTNLLISSKPDITTKDNNYKIILIIHSIYTYQQFNFLIVAKSDCFVRAMTISSVRRVMMIEKYVYIFFINAPKNNEK